MQFFKDYKDNTIRLTDERLEHILLHSEMIEMLDKISETLLNPDYVVESKQDNSVSLYNKFYITEKFGGKFLCVLVKENENDRFIVTAYIMNKIPTGVLLWQKN